ncbi:hypothetical protein DIS18_06980 [Algibacter marinivivus]|uniref:Uncharacterized protein n=1 Tax=Algibacter marinivivus TaxID=2100723 RepID=A0A2U2X929_9FLAO|nr:lipid-binding protein [Algibacter marinivivus]PWH84272.1 hypothetical protein DIS18_06980 [Algibacter marinivivus]
MKNINIYRTVLVLFTISLFFSCDEGGEPDPGGTNVQDIAGDWWAVALNPGGATTAFGGDYVQFSTYNTAANDNTFWVDDHNNWMQLKARVTLNADRLTFQSEPNTPELYTDETVTITNGLITRDVFTTESNTLVDQITFNAEFSWDPGTVYEYVGHFRTGFLEDENPHF